MTVVDHGIQAGKGEKEGLRVRAEPCRGGRFNKMKVLVVQGPLSLEVSHKASQEEK